VAQTAQARGALERLVTQIRNLEGSRGDLPQGTWETPEGIARLLNYQPSPGQPGQRYFPSLSLVIGENEGSISGFARDLIDGSFEGRRASSILYPVVTYIFDEADVFIRRPERGEGGDAGSVIQQATLLARRGRKFGLGLGLATQRLRYLDTSIMAQPHTYFISKLARKYDREAIAEAFAISDESLEQTFAFTPGQWLVASHDATGLKGTPFPVQVPNANSAVGQWLEELRRRRHGQ
jgi:hypothetical protein